MDSTGSDRSFTHRPRTASVRAPSVHPHHNSFVSFHPLQGYVPAIPLPKYFNSEWSFAQFRIHDEAATTAGHPPQSIVGFGVDPNTVLVVTRGGSFYKLSFDPVKGGPCSQLSYCKFLERQDGLLEATAVQGR